MQAPRRSRTHATRKRAAIHPVSLARAASVLAPLALAVMQAGDARAQLATLDPVLVTADPLDRGLLDLQRPVSVLRGDELRLREASNLGDTLGRELGVQSSAYGPGAGRPIIRGMDSARVRITESGLGVADVSGASPDHRVAADTLNARQVEVLRGPSTLLYGSGAIGGLVNIVSERVPLRRESAFGAQVSLRASTAERERAGAVDLNGPLGTAASWRIEGFKQRTSDYELAAPLRDVAGDVIAAERLPNSQTDTQSVALGAAWFGDQGRRIGLAAQRYESDYGIPNPDEPVTLRLRRDRYEVHADHGVAFGPFSGLRSKFAATDYRHTEFEPDGAAGATFSNRGLEGRIELPHAAVAGWRGVLGMQLSHNTTRGAGEGELPKVEAQQVALFVVEERSFGRVRAELGARAEREAYDVKESYADGTRAPSRGFSLFTLSAGAGWRFAPAWETTLTLTAGQRAPAVEELYFVGAHPATFAYEVGDPDLKKEQSTNVDLGLRYADGPWRAQANLFVNRVRNYIYGFFDGTTTDVLDDDGNVEESLSNLLFTQGNAQLRGGEAELAYGARSGVQARLWGDTVRARLRGGGQGESALPRMVPTRLGLDLGWRADRWGATLFLTRVFRQERVSSFDLRNGQAEQPTAGYTRLDFGASWRPEGLAVTFFVQGRNLSNQNMRVHTSFLRNLAPPPGRSVVAGVRAAL